MRVTVGGALAALAVAAGVVGCGSTHLPERPPPVQPGAARNDLAICGRLTVRRTGTVRAPDVDELSGLVAGRRRPGVLWGHEDSGADPVLLALRADGTLLGEVTVAGAEAIDWEDIAIRGGQLYVGDIGDNARSRGDVVVYRVPEPDPRADRTAPATAYRLRYPDGAHDAETLLADPRSATLAIVTKEPDGRSRVYVAAHPSPSGTTTLRRVATLRLGIGGLATAGDVSPDGRVIAVRTYTSLVAWRRRAGESLGEAMRRAPCVGRVSLLREDQGESLALVDGGRAFYTAPEGEHPPIRRYEPR